MTGKKIVFITGRHPWPPNKGDQLIAYNQIKRLSRDYDIYLVTSPSLGNKKKAREFEKLCREVIHVNVTRASMFFDALKTLVNGRPFQVNMFTNKKEIQRVGQAIKRIMPDIIHVQTIRMAEYGIVKSDRSLSDGNNPRLIMDMIDLLSLNMKRRASKEKGIKKWIMNLEGRLVEEYEKKLSRYYDRIVFVSDHDASRSNLENTRVNPNGTYVDSERIDGYDIDKKKQILFHGNMNYFPNAEAALYFADKIWPQIYERHPEYRYVIAGRNPGRKVRSLESRDGIIVKANVEDMVEIILESEIGVYLLNSGTGLQNKILEALGAGLPVVASSMALDGIRGIEDNIAIAVDDAEDIIEAIDRLIKDAESRERISMNGKSFMMDRFTWEDNILMLKKIWNEAN